VFSRSLVPVAKYTALLCLFGVAAFRDVQLAFLTVALVSEASSVVHIASKLQRMAGGANKAAGPTTAVLYYSWMLCVCSSCARTATWLGHVQVAIL
jgi:hypothetical protein